MVKAAKIVAIIAACVVVIAVVAMSCESAPPPAIPSPTTQHQFYTLSISVSPSGAGSVSPSGGQYESGLQVTLSATPASEYTFDYWDGAASGSSPAVTITMDSDKSVTAHFKAAALPPQGEVTYAEIRNSMKSMTEAQFKAYARGLKGKKIQWSGYVEDVKETSSGDYELLVDMDAPSVLFSLSDVTFKVPNSIALSLQKDQQVEFEGIISSISNVFGVCAVSLEPANVI